MLAKSFIKHFLIQPLVNRRAPIYEQRFLRSMDSDLLARCSTPKQLLNGATDQYLLWLFSHCHKFGYELKGLIPTLPHDDMQRNWTGSIGEVTLRESLQFFQIVRDKVNLYSRLGPETVVLDYGCGWGRTIRYFLRDVNHENLYGCDCYPQAVEAAAAHNKWCHFELTPPFPPTNLEANKFDLIYLYSVFSHLSEELHLALLQEFKRILRPGGILIATTRHRKFILYCRTLTQVNLPVQLRGSSYQFADTEEALAKYDKGMFCHSPMSGGGVLESSFYGESCISRKYVEQHWTKEFELLDYRYADRKCDQNIITCRKR